MPYRSTAVRSALAFAGSLFGVAPAPCRTLVTREGNPVPYRIALPEEALIETAPGLLSARTEDVVVAVVVTDMLKGDENPLPDSESRRVLTSIVMGSDAVLFALLDEELRRTNPEFEVVVRGMGTLGGQRAACVRGRVEERGVASWLDVHATVQDGILYMLTFTVLGGDLAPHRPLLARIRESFVLPG